MKTGRLVLLPLLVAGCAAAGGWTKPGTDAAATARDVEGCRSLAAETVRPEIDINEDILATRQNDWRRGRIGRIESEAMRDQTRRRADRIVAACMKAKGFDQPG